MKYKILLSGAGQLGSRYLQGLFLYPEKLTVFVHDISLDALENCKLFCSKCTNSNLHDLLFINELDKLPEHLDLAIISSTANARASIVNTISLKSQVRFWILEKVLTQKVIDLEIISNSINKENSAWVNTTRRSWEFYFNLKKHLNKNTSKDLSISGSFGLACNAIHFIDLFSWLTGEKLISIDTSNLNNFWIESKRKGFWEVAGKINVKFSKGSNLVLESNDSFKGMEIVLTDSNFYWNIDENTGTAKRSDGLKIAGNVPLQSQITPILVAEIFNTGSCKLTSLKESIELHKIYLKAFQNHWDKFNLGGEKIIQIT
jgi:hypothetical protein